MTIHSLILQRAQKLMSEFCQRRSTSSLKLQLLRDGEHLVIMQSNPGATDRIDRAMLQFRYIDNQWDLYWMRNDGNWEAYPSLPNAGTIEDIINELEQAPLHIHWG